MISTSIYRMFVFSTLLFHLASLSHSLVLTQPASNTIRSQFFTKNSDDVVLANSVLLKRQSLSSKSKQHRQSDRQQSATVSAASLILRENKLPLATFLGRYNRFTDKLPAESTLLKFPNVQTASVEKRSSSIKLPRDIQREIPRTDKLFSKTSVISWLLRRIRRNQNEMSSSGHLIDHMLTNRRRLSWRVRKLRRSLGKSGDLRRRHNVNYDMSSEIMAEEPEQPKFQPYRLSRMNIDETWTTEISDEETSASENEAEQFIFGGDDRQLVNRTVRRRPPYYNVARLSVGCSGMLITSKHVLTSAHCLHNGTHFISHPDHLLVEVPHWIGNRIYRTAKISVPHQWLKSDVSTKAVYDYGIVELFVDVPGRRFFPHVGLPKGASVSSSISFAGYPADRYPQMWETTCTISNNDFAMEQNLLRTRCDATPGSSGSAVFMNVDRYGRRLVGLVSHMTRTYRGGRLTPVNVITVITPAKRVVICAMVDAKGQYTNLCSARTTESRGRNKYLSLQSTRA
ncbi:uncharacterized protein [Amphiura filiformis]|uniref:uncharacterized protein n=1 Tax=Amphiura filiformis TaxID=82378 RepID=UPI003B2148DC